LFFLALLSPGNHDGGGKQEPLNFFFLENKKQNRMRQGIHMEQHRQKIASPKTQLRQDFFFSLKEKFPLTSDHHGMYTAKKETRDALHTGLFQKRNPKAVPSFFFFLRNNAGRRAFLSYDQDSIRSSSS